MKRIFGAKKDTAPPPSIDDAADRLNKRGDLIDDKIRKLDQQLVQHRENIRRARPGPAQEAATRRALVVLRQKRQYEAQREQLANQQMNIDQTSFMMQGMQDTVANVAAMQGAAAEIKRLQKTNKELNPDKIWNVVDQIQDMHADFEEIQEAMGSYNVPIDVDEDELLGELDALGDELLAEGAAQGEEGIPSYLQDLELPAAPTGVAAAEAVGTTGEQEANPYGSMPLPAGGGTGLSR